MLTEIFSWWGGNTWGTRLFTWRKGKRVGEDEFGNRYFSAERLRPTWRAGALGHYQEPVRSLPGAARWHGWLHHTVDELPTSVPYQPKPWQKPHQMNMTGTAAASRPEGSIIGAATRQDDGRLSILEAGVSTWSTLRNAAGSRLCVESPSISAMGPCYSHHCRGIEVRVRASLSGPNPETARAPGVEPICRSESNDKREAGSARACGSCR